MEDRDDKEAQEKHLDQEGEGDKALPKAQEGKQTGRSALQYVLSFLPRLWGNWISLTGAVIATVAGCTIVLALAAQLVTPSPKPYATALALLIMPAVFIFGLVLIPVGLLWERRRKKKDRPLDPIQAALRVVVQDRRARRRLFFFGLATFLNIVIIGAAGHRALVFMDSTSFCGTLCHSVMEPEYSAYLRSPHSRVRCVDCHIGEGATWAVKSKISGLRQVWAVLVDSYHRPIPTPVKELRPARDTCEQCHWPAKFHGNRVAFYTHYAEDQANTPAVTAVLLKVGGEDPKTGRYHGIHWHVSPEVEVRYQALDDRREKIGKVTRVEKGKVVAEYLPGQGAGQVREERVMDCVDCHNRPTHTFAGSAELALDQAFTSGQLDASVPYLRRMAARVLAREDIPREEAETIFAKDLADGYAQEHPDLEVSEETIRKAAGALAEIYRRNVYPRMKIGWDTYPNHLGHRGEEQDKRGCFRCHNDEHKSKDGKVISMDCDLCHEILHEQESPDALPDSLQALLE